MCFWNKYEKKAISIAKSLNEDSDNKAEKERIAKEIYETIKLLLK